MKRGIQKGIAALITIAFMALVRTNADPQLWQTTLVAIMLYESFDLTVIAVWETKEETKRKRQKQRRVEYMNATKEDMRRVEEQVFNYARTMKEVS